jgi:hypothetical protein
MGTDLPHDDYRATTAYRTRSTCAWRCARSFFVADIRLDMLVMLVEVSTGHDAR